jgi:hypothetical protein
MKTLGIRAARRNDRHDDKPRDRISGRPARVAAALVAALAFGFGAAEADPIVDGSASDNTCHLGPDPLVEAHLRTFDDLDFNVFNNQDWPKLHRSHSNDVKVHWPDGHVTIGLDTHIQDLKNFFVWAPDTRVSEHSEEFGQGPYTGCIGVMEGTFTEPMPIGSGITIPPTGRHFRLQFATIGNWQGGVMYEEFLFWDNQEFYRQLGL